MSGGFGDRFWSRHSNPWSGWTRVALGALLLPALWFHHWPSIAVLLVAMATNPLWFPPPDPARHNLDNFMTRAVEGERLWLERGGRGKGLLAVAGLTLTAGAVWALWTNQLGASAAFLVPAAALKVGFVMWASTLPPRQSR